MIKSLLSNWQNIKPIFRFYDIVTVMQVSLRKVGSVTREYPGSKTKRLKAVKPRLSIIGCRGIPAKYGGFETFAERLALYLISTGWDVTVYCQDSDNSSNWQKYWQGIRLMNIPVSGKNAVSSMIFDWKCILHAAKEQNLILTLGYNTAIFCFWLRLKGLTNVINMDGLEWQRQKWKLPEKAWLYINEWCGCWLGNHLIADHPEIKSHLMTRVAAQKITVIPYGAEEVITPDVRLLQQYGFTKNEYALVIARPEPENNILEIVRTFSSQRRGIKLVVLGRYLSDVFDYHKQVLEAASDEVIFPGAIYEPAITKALRFYTRLYIHGHTVGGTNPSLVEGLAAASPVLAHNNRFNYWVAGTGAHYFNNQEDCARKLDELLNDAAELQRMRQASIKRYEEEFSSQRDVKLYADLLMQYTSVASANK